MTSQSRRLLQAGIVLFLMALIVGLAVPKFAVPRLGLSAHVLGITQALFLMVTGLVWTKLALNPAAARAAFWLALYGCFAAWSANVLAGVWAAGGSMLPLAAGSARGSAAQEAVIGTMLRTAAVSLISTALLIVWGLRSVPIEKREKAEL